MFIPVDREMKKTEMKLPEFLRTNLRGKVMTQIKLRPLSRHYELVTYKVGDMFSCLYISMIVNIHVGIIKTYSSHLTEKCV